MKASNDTSISIIELLDRSRMTRSERLAAEDALAQAERLADAFLAVSALFRSARQGIERGLHAPARRKSYN
jgi:hypothetical protein